MTALKTFNNDQFGTIRVITRNGEPWFFAKDVCDCLALDNNRQAISRLDEDERTNVTINDVGENTGLYDFSNGGQAPVVISEAGLYSLMLTARKPEAKAFKRWITHEVLPSIRKHGVYATEDFAAQSIKDPAWAISVLQTLIFEKEQKRLAELQRDEAIRTKAWIGERREATAMNTASQFSKKCTKLQGENEGLRERLGDAERWKAVTAIKWLRDYFEPTQGLYGAIAAKLKNICKEFGFERRDIPDPKWGVVKIYPIEAIDILRRRIELDNNMLANYRKLEA